MRRLALVVIAIGIGASVLGVAYASAPPESLEWRSAAVEPPWVGVRGNVESDDPWVICTTTFGSPAFFFGDQYYDSVAFSVANAFPGVEVRLSIQVHNDGPFAVALERREHSHAGDAPFMETVAWSVNGVPGSGPGMEDVFLGLPIDPGETLTLEIVRRASDDIVPGHIYWERYVAGIIPPPGPPPVPPPVVEGAGGAAAGEPMCFFDVDMLGVVTRVYVTCAEGRCIKDYEPEDPSGRQFIDLKRGTQVTYQLDGQFVGGPPRWVRMRVSTDPPPLPSGVVALSDVYDFIGYTGTGVAVTAVFFDADVGMQLVYDPDELTEGVAAVGLAAWNPDSGTWEFLPATGGMVAGVGAATGVVSHFSTFAVLATTSEVTAVRTTTTPLVPGPALASFSVEKLTVVPSKEHYWSPICFLSRLGRTATVSAVVVNHGGTVGTFDAELRLDGALAGLKRVRLQAGEQTVVQFDLINLPRGGHLVEIAGQSTSLHSSWSVNWPTLLGVLGALAVLVLVVVRVSRRNVTVTGHAD